MVQTRDNLCAQDWGQAKILQFMGNQIFTEKNAHDFGRLKHAGETICVAFYLTQPQGKQNDVKYIPAFNIRGAEHFGHKDTKGPAKREAGKAPSGNTSQKTSNEHEHSAQGDG